jgi:hypothetical protein
MKRKAPKAMVHLTQYSRVPRVDFVSITVDTHDKTKMLEPSRLYSARDIFGHDAYDDFLRQFGVLPEHCLNYMINKGYVSLRHYRHDIGDLYTLCLETIYFEMGDDQGVLDIPLNRLLFDIE